MLLKFIAINDSLQYSTCILIFTSACHLITVLLDVKTLMLEFLDLYVGAVVVLTVKYSKME